MKKLFTRFLVALAATLFSASSDAAWDSRFFPTTNAPLRVDETFAFDVVASQMVWAVSERYWAVKKTSGWMYREPGSSEFIDAIQWYTNQPPRKYENILLAVKTGVGAIVKDFLDIDAMTNGPNEIIYHTTTGLLARLSLPQDYFDVIPVRNAMGHDWPTNNPARQSGKDYGWHGLYMIMSNLTHTLEGGFLKEIYEERYSFVGGPLSCSTLTESNFPRNISSYVGGASANDYFSIGAYTLAPDLFGEGQRIFFNQSRSSGVIGRKAAWLYNKEIAGVDFEYLDAAAQRWVTTVGSVDFSYDFRQGESFDSIFNAVSNACPELFNPVFIPDGESASNTILDDGNLLKTSPAPALALPCTAQSLIGIVGSAVQESDSTISSDCAFAEYFGGNTRYLEVFANQNYAHILNWNFRYK
jgi:hypothetical protein